jgi:CPA1 family monovalent cation:H+ antiporter
VIGLEIVLVLLAASAALEVVAQRYHLPHPVLLVIGGAVLALLPGLPPVALDPEVAFLIFVPPLLYSAAINTSLRDFRAGFWPIIRLAVLLVLVTIAAVAVTAHALAPEFTWAAAFALAAIVSPPDPVAATAVMRPLGAPASLASILEGEGMINDAMALVVYRIAVNAAATGTFSAGHAAARLALTGAGGVVIGLVVGRTIAWLRRHIRGLPIVQNTVSLLTPFAAYLPADRLGASGVLAVVTVGLYLSRKASTIVTAATRVQADAIWSMATFVLESLAFILIGFELPNVLRALERHSLGTLLWYGAAVSLVTIAVRLVWVFPSAYIPWLFTRHARKRAGTIRPPPAWREVVFVGWAGMRGAVSLAIALALPLATIRGTPFPARELIVFVTFTVIFATLVLQGLSLGPMIRLLGLYGDNQGVAEEAHARRITAEAGLHRLDAIASRREVDPAVVQRLRRMHGQRARRWAARDQAQHGTASAKHRELAEVVGARADHAASDYRTLRLEMIEAERGALVRLRDRGAIGDDVMRRLQRDLDFETLVLEGAEDDAPESPYEAS